MTRAGRWGIAAGGAVVVAVSGGAASAATPTVQVSATPIAKPLTSAPARATVAVANPAKGRLTGLIVTVAAHKGVRVTVSGAKKGSRSRRLRPLAGGRGVRVTVTLRRLRNGPRKGTLGYRITRGGRTLARGRLAFGSGGSSTTNTPPADPNSLAGRYFWGSLYSINGIDQHTLYFTGPNLVDTAPTQSALPACPAPSDTCKPYTYDAATNQLVIDGKPATLQGRDLTFNGDSYSELGFPAAGARWDAVLTYSNSTGICPLYCNYYTENLTFSADGRFARDAVASGTGPIVDWSSVPPDQQGTYEVRPDHTLRLLFADGHQRVATIGLYLNPDGSLKAAAEGIILGGDGYFDISD